MDPLPLPPHPPISRHHVYIAGSSASCLGLQWPEVGKAPDWLSALAWSGRRRPQPAGFGVVREGQVLVVSPPLPTTLAAQHPQRGWSFLPGLMISESVR